MRWYHFITTYMIIIGGLALAAIGGDLGWWFVITCILMIVLGVVGTVYLPGNKEDEVHGAL